MALQGWIGRFPENSRNAPNGFVLEQIPAGKDFLLLVQVITGCEGGVGGKGGAGAVSVDAGYSQGVQGIPKECRAFPTPGICCPSARPLLPGSFFLLYQLWVCHEPGGCVSWERGIIPCQNPRMSWIFPQVTLPSPVSLSVQRDRPVATAGARPDPEPARDGSCHPGTGPCQRGGTCIPRSWVLNPCSLHIPNLSSPAVGIGDRGSSSPADPIPG